MQATSCSARLALGSRSLSSTRAFGRQLPVAACRAVAARRQVVRAAAESEDVGAAGVAAIGLGLAANPMMLFSLYTLKTTGAGVPPGPGGLFGAAEGISYLVVLGVVGWSAYTKVKTGSGLPAGPAGLLGAVEGFSYLSLLAGIVVFGLQAAS